MALDQILSVLVPASATAPAGAYDLTDLATAKDELGLTTNDTTNDSFLSRAITQASSAIATYCSRVFIPEIVQETIYLRRIDFMRRTADSLMPLQLARWPLLDPSPVSLTGDTHDTTTIDNLSTTSGIYVGEPIFGAGIALGASIATLPGGSSLTLGLPSGASNPPAATGVALTTSMQVTETDADGTVTQLVFGTDYTIDAARGWLIRLDSSGNPNPSAWEGATIAAVYRGGYSSMPADLTDACLRLVTQRFKGKGRDPMQMTRTQPGLGEERFWVGTQPGQNGVLPPEIAALVEPYRVSTVG